MPGPTPGRRGRGSGLRLVIPAAAMAACAGSDETPRVSPEPARLELVREWLRPDLTPETDWLTYPQEMAYDPATGHLFVQDRDWKTVLEITSHGELVRTYGRAGEGPGELGHASGIAIDDERMYALDAGNLKLVAFRRRDGSVEREFRIGRFYRDLTVLPDGRIMVVPGEEYAVAVLDSAGTVVGGLGRRGDIRGNCSFCALARLPDGRVVVLDGNRPDMYVFSGGETRWIDLHSMPLLARWREEIAADLRRIERMGGGRSWMGSQADVAGPRHVTVRVGPPGIMTTGLELWRIDIDTGNVERYEYGEPHIGYTLAIDWPRVFTVHIRDAAILEYRAPKRSGR